ncbi:AAA family ATPase [Ruminococcus sp.]|uniref:nSTAND3 domain-containing NTPase n=1 Tax=Ruminococcus sp. TaxID=41978 RepID=UPI00345D7D74
MLKYKKNIILQGSPGVGKTFTAKRLAYSLMARKMIAVSSLSSSTRAIHTRTLSWAIVRMMMAHLS